MSNSHLQALSDFNLLGFCTRIMSIQIYSDVLESALHHHLIKNTNILKYFLSTEHSSSLLRPLALVQHPSKQPLSFYKIFLALGSTLHNHTSNWEIFSVRRLHQISVASSCMALHLHCLPLKNYYRTCSQTLWCNSSV